MLHACAIQKATSTVVTSYLAKWSGTLVNPENAQYDIKSIAEKPVSTFQIHQSAVMAWPLCMLIAKTNEHAD
jgi:hypothetical protein